MMRITNSMMTSNTKCNINSNKYTVDRLNSQMSTQKKIVKPSDNPLIAIRSLRLGTTLSQIKQFADTNIPDAESWMDVTETALTNMKSILTDAYRLAVNGGTDTLTEEDRNTILNQLRGLSNQLYSELNADYAGRTVFSGYKTNSTITFTNDTEARNAKYDITQELTYENIKEQKFYANEAKVPTPDDIAAGTAQDADPEEIVLNRLRLAYNGLSDLNNTSYSMNVETSSTKNDQTIYGKATIHTEMGWTEVTPPDVATQTNKQSFEWETKQNGTTFIYHAGFDFKMTGATIKDIDGNELTINSDGTFSADATELTRITKNNTTTYTNAAGDIVFRIKEETAGSGKYVITDGSGNKMMMTVAGGQVTEMTDVQGNTIVEDKIYNADYDAANPANPIVTLRQNTAVVDLGNNNEVSGDRLTIETSDKQVTTELSVCTMTQNQYEKFLEDAAADPDLLEACKNTMIYLPDSGEAILGSKLRDNVVAENASFSFDYAKERFEKGEVRPEMYYNCTNKTDISPANWITYENWDENGEWIAQDINYQVSANQVLNVNTQAGKVVDSNCYRDLEEMTDAVQRAIDAHAAVDEIEGMLKSSEYTSDDAQKYLNDALKKAKKQADYADDYLHTIFSRQITNFENYLNDVNITITDVGSKGERLALASNRMDNQKTTFTQLKSNNEDVELSDVTIDFTSSYQAYQASLQAAGKIEGMSLLDYL